MKKFIVFSICLCLLCFSCAFAAPSITVDDMITVQAATSTGIPVREDFLVDVKTENSACAAVREQLQNADDVVAFFPPDIQDEIHAVFFPSETAHVQEVMPISFSNYDSQYENVEVCFEFPTSYQPESHIVVVVGTQIEEEMTWTICEERVTDDGMLAITFPAEIIHESEGYESVLVILSF